ncbi:MAG TPA: cytochrome c biogenesis protein ResB [Methylibium sp.]
MTASTTGLELSPARSRHLREAVELVSSMRFAIALLTLICIASIIGTVVQQQQPAVNYVNQFGSFWASVFGTLRLDAIYSAPWFLLILAFLVISTSLCIVRNTPKILHELRSFKEHLREQSLRAFHHKAEGELPESGEAALQRLSTLLAQEGWQAKAERRERGVMIAARKGMANKLGYLAAHSAIVLVCLGGLFDGDLIVRAQMWARGVTPYVGSGFVRDVGAAHRLPASNPTFRGTLTVSEGQSSSIALLPVGEGVVLQELPFDIELRKFVVDFYATGMPKLFASDILIHDRDSGQVTAATVKVNQPVIHRGIAIYQSSFEDGGSHLKLRAYPMGGMGQPFDVQGQVGGSTTLASAGGDASQQLALEFSGLRVINVENLGGDNSSTDVRKVDLVGALEQHLGSGAKTTGKKELLNVGPSVSYKLRDAAGQAREYNNYMLPITLDGQRVFLAGVRDTPADNFRYLRIPADEQGSMDGWLRLRRALADAAMREQAAQRYAALAMPDSGRPELTQQLRASALRALNLFAGVEPAREGAQPIGGLQAIADFMEANVPEADRARTSEVLVRILNGTLFELLNLSREQASLAPLKPGETTQAFMTSSVLSLSDAAFYPAPVLLALQDFKQVQASGFQVTRTPGKKLVYLGCLLLILGVFAMLYIRERRLWIWLQPAGHNTRVLTALSATRQTLDAGHEFERLKKAILQEA